MAEIYVTLEAEAEQPKAAPVGEPGQLVADRRPLE
jgi:hypothetical protein